MIWRESEDSELGGRVLIIDSAADGPEELISILEPLGNEVIWAADGLAGIERFSDEIPDLVFVNLTLGGASGGFTTGRKAIVEYLRQRSRPYLFSNTVAPPIVAGALKALEMVQARPELREALRENTAYFRTRMTSLGFDIVAGDHPIVPVMLGDERKAGEMARAMNDRGIFVVGFSYPVVPKGEARIRVQLSAAHTADQLDRALSAFEEVGKTLGVI